MEQIVTEDDIYRTSSQYRLWSFTPAELHALRTSTHTSAAQHAQSYLPSSTPILTLPEELALVQRYCEQLRTTTTFFQWPINVRATAIQYLKRFYLTNSALTHPPKDIYKSVLFLASKTEGVHMTLAEYARRIKTPAAAVLAPEHKIVQALRFTLDVRQPYRALRGVLMELLNIASAARPALPGHDAAELLRQLDALRPHTAQGPAASQWVAGRGGAVDRVQAAYAAARATLDAPALLTDAWLLYTPPQMCLGALLLADGPLAEWYLAAKLGDGVGEDVLGAVRGCADVLAAFDAAEVLSKEARAALEEKLEACRDPGTRDLIGMNSLAKTDGLSGAEAEEKARIKAEKAEGRRKGDDVFGPTL